MTLRRLFAPITAYVILTILGLFWLVPFAWPVLASSEPHGLVRRGVAASVDAG
jgi:ABC-type glycerol-3-phosphate transport system permease component